MMPISTVYDFCSSLKGVTEDLPFDEHILTFKVGGKIFALLSLPDWEQGTGSINLKCDPDKAQELRAMHQEIIPGFHMNKKHWNTVDCQGNLDSKIILELIVHSYELVLKGLPKKVREML